LDRAAIETLFGVGRRRAIQLLHQIGGYQAGKTFLIERNALLRQLNVWAGSAAVQHETTRRRRLTDALAEARAEQRSRTLAIPPPPPETASAGIEELPGVTWAPGELRVRFETGQELLSQLLGIALAVQRDLPAFERLCASPEGILSEPMGDCVKTHGV
jgi:hypothetical protein